MLAWPALIEITYRADGYEHEATYDYAMVVCGETGKVDYANGCPKASELPVGDGVLG